VDAFEFGTPDFGPARAQVVLSVDEAGALHWHFPLDDDLAVQPSTTRGAEGTKVFRIPRGIARPSGSGHPDERGLVSIAGRKLLKVLVYDVTDRAVGEPLKHAIGKWEDSHRPHCIRHYLPGDRTPLAPGDWPSLSAGRTLLFVHGGGSTAAAAFGSLSCATLDALATRYGNRVIAFDHPTLSVDFQANARWFFQQLPKEVSLKLDVVCHSRGGLVGRCLGGFWKDYGIESGRFAVERLVLVAYRTKAPCSSTPSTWWNTSTG